jgi:hypothetical protein
LQPADAESRAKVQSRRVETPEGVQLLDDEPDVREVLLLADELGMDEVLALRYVLAAHGACGEVSAAAAAGVFFEERLALTQALAALLHAQVTDASALSAEAYNAVGVFNAKLLCPPAAGGESLLVRRLAALLQSDALAAAPGSRLPVAVDAFGRGLDRTAAAQREHAALAECLLYAHVIRQRGAPADVGRLLDVLQHLALHARGAAGASHRLAAQRQANLALVAFLLATLPIEDAEGRARDEDDAALKALAADAAVGAKVAQLEPRDDPYAAAAHLAWGLLLLCSETREAAAVAMIDAALAAGALGFLRAGVLDSVPMADESEDVRGVAASVALQLLMLFWEVAAEGKDTLKERSVEGARAEKAEPVEAPSSAALMAVDGRFGAPAPSPPDSLAALLGAVAATLRLRPALFLDEARRSVQLGALAADACSQALADVPSVLVAYLGLLTAVAETEAGARAMFHQLRVENAAEAVSWRRMFDALRGVVCRYALAAEGGAEGAPPPFSDVVLPVADTLALCAFARLFGAVFRAATPEEAAAWARQLEDDAGEAPCWEVLVQAMCSPVPQALKAALDDALAALARRPEIAAALWERLLAAVVVAPGYALLAGGGGAPAGGPHYDLVHQLTEVEARAEDYPEALSFVRLLNALWRGAGGQLADDGRPVAHLARFVREDVLAPALQRAYRDDAQRWELVAAALEHCELCLGALTALPAALAAEAGAPAGAPRPPGLDVLLDLLGERSAMRAALATLSCGGDHLAHERHAAPYGAAREAAALAALRLINAGLAHDVAFVEAAARAAARPPPGTLDAVLRHDRARLPLLLEYARYAHSPAIQAEALRLAATLAARVPNLVPLLLSAPPAGGAPVAQRLQDGFAACLHDAVAAAPAEAGEVEADEADPRAALALALLLGGLEAPSPNLTQLLCGFDVEGGASPMALLDPRALHTPLRVALEVLAAPRLARRRPRLFEQCLELVYELAAAPDTGPATLDLLRAYHATLLPLLDTVACAPLDDCPARAASLHQRAWLLHLFALELHRADPAVPRQRDSAAAALAALFTPDDAGAAGGVAGRSRAVDVLAVAVHAPPAEPQPGAAAAPEARRMAAALDVDALLAGACVAGPRGDALVDVGVLKDELLARITGWQAQHGAAGEAVKEAGRAALAYAAAYNGYAEAVGGHAALLGAWRTLVTVALTRRFDALAAVTAGAPVDLLLGLADDTLRALTALLAGPGAALAPELAATAAVVFARLQEQVVAAATANPLGGLPLPARCHSLLGALLAAVWAGRAQAGVRVPLYSALAAYLSMCCGPEQLRAPPAVVAALLEGVRGGGPAALEQLDALQMHLEDGNVALWHANLRLLEPLAADAAAPDAQTAAAALVALAALVSADPTPATAEEIHRVALTSRLLQELEAAPPPALAAPTAAGQAATLVAECRLTLLLRLALAGPPAQKAAAAQRLFSLQTLPRLARCAALDLQPEEPGFGGASGASASLRARLHSLAAPALRLVLAVLAALPHSAAAAEQAANFVEAHARALARVLRDAASPSVRGWAPGDAELEQAALVVQLLAELARRRTPLSPEADPPLREAAYRAAARFLAADARSASPPVQRVHAAREAGALAPRDLRTGSRLLELRAAVAAYLRALTSGDDAPVLLRASPGAAGGEPAGTIPTLLLVKDALVQAAAEQLPEALGDEAALAAALRGGDAAAAADVVSSRGLGTPGKGPAAARAAAARAATQRQGDAARLLALVEHLLAVLHQHLSRCAPGAPGETAPRPTLDDLGSPRDLDQLRRLTAPAIAALERLLGEGALPGDQAGLELLVRRTKELLMAL